MTILRQTSDAERGGEIGAGGVIGDAASVGAAVARRQCGEHQQRELVQTLLLDLKATTRWLIT